MLFESRRPYRVNGKGGFGHRLIILSYTARTKLYRLLQYDACLAQDIVGRIAEEGICRSLLVAEFLPSRG